MRMGPQMLVGTHNDFGRVYGDSLPHYRGLLSTIMSNLLKRETSLKGGIQSKRLKAAWDHDYMLKVLAA